MRRIGLLVVSLSVVLAAGGSAKAQVAGSTSIAVAVEELREVAVGWSARKHILGKAVYNEKNEKVGAIDDVIVTPARAISYVIVGAAGFVGIGRHDGAIPAQLPPSRDWELILPGPSQQAVH